jgi:hypothetical protein
MRVAMRIVSVGTSQILPISKADGSGSVLDAITGAAGDQDFSRIARVTGLGLYRF